MLLEKMRRSLFALFLFIAALPSFAFAQNSPDVVFEPGANYSMANEVLDVRKDFIGTEASLALQGV